MTGNYAITSKKGSAILNLLAYLFVICMNALAVALPLNGKSTGQLSDQYPNLFTPAGLTFSIWSIIYLLLLGFIIFQGFALVKTNHPSRNKVISISLPFLINCLANAGWILAWHYEYVALSVAIMLLLLGSLIAIHERLHLALPLKPLVEKLWLDLPFSLYLGWISIATIANITALLVDMRWNNAGIAPDTWTIILIITGTLLNMYMVLFKNNIPFGLVGIWAFTGIIIKRQASDDENINQIIFSSQICISLVALSIILEIFRLWKKNTE